MIVKATKQRVKISDLRKEIERLKGEYETLERNYNKKTHEIFDLRGENNDIKVRNVRLESECKKQNDHMRYLEKMSEKYLEMVSMALPINPGYVTIFEKRIEETRKNQESGFTRKNDYPGINP